MSQRPVPYGEDTILLIGVSSVFVLVATVDTIRHWDGGMAAMLAAYWFLFLPLIVWDIWRCNRRRNTWKTPG